MNNLEQSSPADVFREWLVLIRREPNHRSLANYVVFRHKAPETRVKRVVAVVAHHPVIVHCKCVAVSLFAIYIYGAVLNLQVVAFVYAYNSLIQR